MYYVYILFSESLNHFYTGFSTYRGVRRRQHNRGRSQWTSRADDWVEILSIKVASREEARELEKRIKARGARRFLADLQRRRSGEKQR
jgi:putative endonuclease